MLIGIAGLALWLVVAPWALSQRSGDRGNAPYERPRPGSGSARGSGLPSRVRGSQHGSGIPRSGRDIMTIGAALLLIAAGAVLRFAISTPSVHGFDLYVIGDILMGVGILGLVLWLLIWLPRTRSQRPVYEPPPDVPPRGRDPYRVGDPYPGERYRTEPYPEDQRPR